MDSAWRYVVTDNSFNPIGEVLNAADRRCTVALNHLTTASLTLRLDNPMSAGMMEADAFLKVYRQGQLVHFGPIISAEIAGQGLSATMSLNSFSVGWFLQKRLAGKSATGTVFTLTDRAQIIKQLIDTANTEGETHISTSGPISAASASVYTAGPYKPIMDCITDLSASLDGFDWRVRPIEPNNNKIGQFEAYPLIGVLQSEAVFESGTGRCNIGEFSHTVTRDQQANKVYHFTSNGPDNPTYPTVFSADGASIGEYGLMEDIAQADILDATLRTKLVQEHVNVRRLPRCVVDFTPHIDDGTGRLPNFGVDYDVGDLVIGRAAFDGRLLFDGTFRVWGVDFDVDAAGMERQKLTLAEEN